MNQTGNDRDRGVRAPETRRERELAAARRYLRTGISERDEVLERVADAMAAELRAEPAIPEVVIRRDLAAVTVCTGAAAAL